MPKTIKQYKKKLKNTGKSLLRNSTLTRQLRNPETAGTYLKNNDVPALTAQEKAEIDSFWAEYGVRILNYDYYRMFYHVTGKHDPRFIPDSIAHRVLLPYYNDAEKMRAYVDKNMFQRLLPDMPFPKMFGQCMNGHFFGPDGRYVTDELTDEYVRLVYDAFMEAESGKSNHTAENAGETASAATDGTNNVAENAAAHALIIKQSQRSFCGKGVSLCKVESPADLRRAIEENNSGNFLIQAAIRQHAFFRQFNESSVNIMRITSWRHGGDVEIFCPCIRYGIEGSHTDVAFVDGEEIVQVVGIGADGVIYEGGVTMSGKPLAPVIPDKQVPNWDKVVETVRRNHLQLPYFDLVGWDFTLDEAGNVVCIEYNLLHPGTIIYQFAHGPLAGEHTEEFLSFLKDPANREKYLPAAARL